MHLYYMLFGYNGDISPQNSAYDKLSLRWYYNETTNKKWESAEKSHSQKLF